MTAGMLLAAPTRAEELLADDPWWLIVLKAVALFGFLVLITLFNIWAERRVVARMQMRVGPNRAGPFGILQGLADGIKLALKEDIVPTAAHKAVFVLAPILSTVPAFLAIAVIPFGPEVSIFGERTVLQLTDFPVAVLYLIAVASVSVYGIVLAGWSSGSTYPLLGGLRSSAQMISYEVVMGLSFVAVFLYAGSMSTSQIVESQQSIWYAVALAPSFVFYCISMVGETNRAPFDLPEAEGELVGGFHTEYSSLKFALFFLAEYVAMVSVSAVATTLFLGGWHPIWPISLWDGASTGWWPLLWWISKVLVFIFVFIWLRGTLPRLRYDQFMAFGWKRLIPFSLVWILAVATLRAFTNGGVAVDRRTVFLAVGAVIVAVLLLSFVADAVAARRGRADRPTGTDGVRGGEAGAGRAAGGDGAYAGASVEEFDAFAGGYPVPPLPWQQRTALSGAATRTEAGATSGAAGPPGATRYRPDDEPEESPRA